MQMVKLRGFDHYTLLSRLLHAARENNPPKRMPPAMFRLDGDVAIVTGAGSRIPGMFGRLMVFIFNLFQKRRKV